MLHEIKTFIDSGPRHKLIIAKPPIIDELTVLNVGEELSKELIKLSFDDKNFSLKAKKRIETILDSNINQSQEIGEYLAIDNFGILFEKELKLDFISLIEKYSKLYTLILLWNGDIENNDLYFLLKNTGKKIQLTNLSCIHI